MEEKGFIVSALKYRPSEWHQVIGQKGITDTLQNAIASEEVAKAYLFCGPRGVGKTTCARIFAKAINSKYIQEGQDLSFNVFELDAASNNSVDDIRQLIDQVRIQPQLGKYKVYIIDEVHMLSSQAFNAFLKTLEEPPPHAIFILATTEKHKVLPTILSRCQIYDFQRISVKDMVQHLASIADDQGVSYDEQSLHLIASKADGALRDALSLFDQMVSFTQKNLQYKDVAENLNVLDHEYFQRIVGAMSKGEINTALLTYDEILKKGFDSLMFIVGLAQHLRDVLVAKDPATVSLLDVPDEIRQDYLNQSASIDRIQLIQSLNILNETEVQYRASKNKRLTTELALMKLCSLSAQEPMVIVPQVQKKKKPTTEIAKAAPAEVPKPEVAKTIEPLTEVPASKPITTETLSEAQGEIPSVSEPRIEVPKPLTSSPPSIEKESQEVSSVNSKEDEIQATPSKSMKKRGRGISLMELDEEEDEENLSTSEEKGGHVEGKRLLEGDLERAWKEYAKKIYEQGKFSFHSTLSNRKPLILNDHTIGITLENEVQMEDLEHEKAGLMSYLRERLEHPGIMLEATIDLEDISNMGFRSPREQLKEMVKKNPTLGKMYEQFDLDLE